MRAAYSLAILASLFLPASAHFSLTFPEGRGDNDKTQAQSPCGGINTPSEDRTEWPITGGGQLAFRAGHPEAKTAVYLSLGNNPVKKDFNITIVDVFTQVGLGEFCWNSLELPGNLTVEDGQNATIQVVQQGHDGGGLYNCADITFKDKVASQESCSNSTGVTAKPAGSAHSGSSSSSASPSASVSSNVSSSTSPSPTSAAAAGGMMAAGGTAIAVVIGVGAWLL